MNAWRTIKKSGDTGRLDRNAVREAVIALRERRIAAECESERRACEKWVGRGPR